MTNPIRFREMPGDANRDAARAMEDVLRDRVDPRLECAYSLRSLAEGSNRVELVVSLSRDEARTKVHELFRIRCIPYTDIDVEEVVWRAIGALAGTSPEEPPRP